MLKLLSAGASPYARKVRAGIIEKGLEDRIEVVDTPTSPVESNLNLVDVNPLARLPSLVTEAGDLVHDSRTIMRFIDGLSSAAPLYPDDDTLFARLSLESTAEGALDLTLALVYERRLRPAEMHFEPLLKAQETKVLRTLDWLESNIGDLADRDFDAAAIGVACLLGYIDFRQPIADWRPGRPGLTAWFVTVASRPSMAQTEPVG